MCGRYSIIKHDQIVKLVHNVTVQANLRFVERLNVRPTDQVPVIAAAGVEMMRWGLIPSWTKDEKKGGALILARAETVMEKPSFRTSFKSRRCLIPADSFIETRENPDGSRTSMQVQLKDQSLFAFGGVWDTWRNSKGEDVLSFAIITTTPNSLMATIHERMPVIIPREGYLDWLEGERPQDWLQQYPAEEMEARELNQKTNAPKKDCPGLFDSAA